MTDDILVVRSHDRRISRSRVILGLLWLSAASAAAGQAAVSKSATLSVRVVVAPSCTVRTLDQPRPGDQAVMVGCGGSRHLTQPVIATERSSAEAVGPVRPSGTVVAVVNF